MILVLDTETTGITIKDRPDDHPDQPHLVQLGLIQIDNNWAEAGCASLIVRPDGWTIPDHLVGVHGISTERAMAVGIPLLVALAVYTNMRAIADAIVAHNAEFDLRIMAVALARCGRVPANAGPATVICTADLATPILNLSPTERMLAAGIIGPKRPSLRECYQHFFGEDVPGAHNALSDARACARVYRALRP